MNDMGLKGVMLFAFRHRWAFSLLCLGFCHGLILGCDAGASDSGAEYENAVESGGETVVPVVQTAAVPIEDVAETDGTAFGRRAPQRTQRRPGGWRGSPCRISL